MPILGVIASGISGHLTPPWPANSYESIATATVGSGGSSTVSFSSIPATYTHLQVRLIARSGRTDSDLTAGGLYLQLNSNFLTANHQLRANGSSVSASANSGGGSNGAIIIWVPATGAATGVFGVAIIDILDYVNTNKNKVVRILGGEDLNGSGIVTSISGLLNSTSTLTSITFGSTDGVGNIPEYSQFALYGIKVS
jgi:hypothetical protein